MTFENLTVTAASLGLDFLPAQPPIPEEAEPLAFPSLTEEELAADESGTDSLVAVSQFGLTDLKAYWSTGMRATLPTSMVRRSVGERLEGLSSSLPEGWGLAIFDAYRPLALQRRLYAQAYADPSLEPGYVAVPSDNPLSPPAHATGAALDLTLSYQGCALALGTAYDEFTPRAGLRALEEEESVERELRRVLYHLLTRAGFTGYQKEWWHFEYGTGRWAAKTGQRPLFGQPMSFED